LDAVALVLAGARGELDLERHESRDKQH
jgi:hypothetical protein